MTIPEPRRSRTGPAGRSRSCAGRRSRAVSLATPTRASGYSRSRQRWRFQTWPCRASMASAPTSTSSPSHTTRSISFPPATLPPLWELNIWYHTLNCGFRTRISGETDFPCLSDTRIGQARSYVQIDGKLDFDACVEAIREGRSYVSDGYSHIVDFQPGEVELGTEGSELRLDQPAKLAIRARVAGLLSQFAQDKNVEAPAGPPYRAMAKEPHKHATSGSSSSTGGPTGASRERASAARVGCPSSSWSTARPRLSERSRPTASGMRWSSMCKSKDRVGSPCASRSRPLLGFQGRTHPRRRTR